MKRVLCLGALVALLVGCALQEERTGYWGEEAYSVTKVQDGVYKVTIREDLEAVPPEDSDITLMRCADAALAHGFNYFEFLDRRFLVIQCYKERPAENSDAIYDATQWCSPPTKEGGE